MKRIAKVAAVSAAGLGLLIGATPAQATTGAVAFVGNATLAPGLIYPIPPASVGSNGTWTLTSLAGVGVSDAPAVGTASLNVSGNLESGEVQDDIATAVPALAYLGSGGFCGLSGGNSGTGAIGTAAVVGPSATVNVRNVGWAQSVASLIVFHGDTYDSTTGNDTGDLDGVVSALPNPTAGSCSNGTAVSFVVVGAGVATF